MKGDETMQVPIDPLSKITCFSLIDNHFTIGQRYKYFVVQIPEGGYKNDKTKITAHSRKIGVICLQKVREKHR